MSECTNTEIEISIRKFYRSMFDTEEELSKFIKSHKFTYSFGEVPVLENRNSNPIQVMKYAMKMEVTDK